MKKAVVVIFIIFLLLPVIGLKLNLDSGFQISENRLLASKPFLSLQDLGDYSALYNSYFNDNFGFRPRLLELGHLIDIKLFHIAPPGSDVTIGKNGRLFYTPTVTYLDTINATTFSQTDLQGISSNLEAIQSHFSSEGIKFYFLVAPNAQTIYPEDLPDSVKKVSPESRLEQITNYFQAKGIKVNFINPVPDLQKAKRSDQLYYKYDTHWDDYGAFIAYQDLIGEINKDFPAVLPKKLSDYSVKMEESSRKDLETQMGLSGYYHEKVPTFVPKFSPQASDLTAPCPDPYVKCPRVEKEIKDSDLPKAVVYRDSFFTAVIPFLSENFSESTYLWGGTPYPTAVITSQHPDIVIFEITERELWRLTGPLFDFQTKS